MVIELNVEGDDVSGMDVVVGSETLGSGGLGDANLTTCWRVPDGWAAGVDDEVNGWVLVVCINDDSASCSFLNRCLNSLLV